MRILVKVSGRDEPIELEGDEIHIDLNPATNVRRNQPEEWLTDQGYLKVEWDPAGYVCGMRLVTEARSGQSTVFGIPPVH